MGPAREGSQKKPCESKRPELATFVRLLYSPIKTGIVARDGRHPAESIVELQNPRCLKHSQQLLNRSLLAMLPAKGGLCAVPVFTGQRKYFTAQSRHMSSGGSCSLSNLAIRHSESHALLSHAKPQKNNDKHQ